MPATALNHFQQDIARARAVVVHAEPLPAGTQAERLLRCDFLRGAWMFAVGGLDAYFCDAYTDIVAAALIAKSRHPALALPEFFYEIKLPVRAILEPYSTNVNWRWRMAARKMMERENVLSLATVQTLFNKFFRRGYRFFGDLIPSWIAHPDAGRYFFGITAARYNGMPPDQQRIAAQNALEYMQDRFAETFQRRHDCIHNCDRPRNTPQPLPTVRLLARVIEDIEFLVRRCDEHIHTELRRFLLDRGCPATIVRQCGY